jgi:hypothetical protein
MMSVCTLTLALLQLWLRKKTFEVIGINNIGVAVDGPFNTMGWWFPAGSSILRLLALRLCTSHLKQQWLWLAIL